MPDALVYLNPFLTWINSHLLLPTDGARGDLTCDGGKRLRGHGRRRHPSSMLLPGCFAGGPIDDGLVQPHIFTKGLRSGLRKRRMRHNRPCRRLINMLDLGRFPRVLAFQHGGRRLCSAAAAPCALETLAAVGYPPLLDLRATGLNDTTHTRKSPRPLPRCAPE